MKDTSGQERRAQDETLWNVRSVTHSWNMKEGSPLTNDQHQIKMERGIRSAEWKDVGMLDVGRKRSTWVVVSRREKLTKWENTKPEIHRRQSFGDLEMGRLDRAIGEAGDC